ncbi:hypothetical protein VNO77_24124 [Canavalia gladiata]|uniref:Formin-like protein n=1 Tax=Canavalia gladiata TaxID=3824 RepID=A0AAN9QCB6_CANGL
MDIHDIRVMRNGVHGSRLQSEASRTRLCSANCSFASLLMAFSRSAREFTESLIAVGINNLAFTVDVVFDCCFTTDSWNEGDYKVYMDGIVGQLRENMPDASILVFNFREEDTKSQMANTLCEYDITIMDYPRHYEGCPVLKMELIHHFLRSGESWLSLGQQNVLLMHCERGGWPVLAFMLAALLIYRKVYSGEQRTLDMIYKQAPQELLHLLTPLNPMPSQMRYLQYISRRNVALDWPPLDRALMLDCIILRSFPNFDGEGGCHPMFRIYGQDPFSSDKNPKMLYSTPKRSRNVRTYKQVNLPHAFKWFAEFSLFFRCFQFVEDVISDYKDYSVTVFCKNLLKSGECELIKIDISCHIQGDVLVEGINLNGDMEHEMMMFRVMLNTAFVRSNILMLNRDEIDVLWDTKDHFPKDFRAEVLFSEMDAAAAVMADGTSCFEEKEGLPMEAFAKVQEIFSHVDWLNPKADAALNVLQQIGASAANDRWDTVSDQCMETGTSPHETGPRTPRRNSNDAIHPLSSTKRSPDTDKSRKEDKTNKFKATPQQPNTSNNIHQETASSSERNLESRNCPTGSTSLGIKLRASDPAFSSTLDTSFSPQTPPLRPPSTSRANRVHDSPPHKESPPPHILTLQSRHQSQEISHSSTISSPTPGTQLSSTFQSKSPAETTSTKPSPSLSSKTHASEIPPIRTRLESSPSRPPTPPPPPTPPLKDHRLQRAGPPPPPPPPKNELHVEAGAIPPASSPMNEEPKVRDGHPPPPPPPPPKDEQPVGSKLPSPPPPHCLSGKAAGPTIAPAAPSLPAPPPPPSSAALSSDQSPAAPAPAAPAAPAPPAPAVPAAPPPPPPPVPAAPPPPASAAPVAPPPPPPPGAPAAPPPPPPPGAPAPPPPPGAPAPPPPPGAPAPPPPPGAPAPPPPPGAPAPPPPPGAPAAPPPPASPSGKGGLKPGGAFPWSLSAGGSMTGRSSSPTSSKGRILSRTIGSKNTKKLKPLHWLKLSRAVQGSLWAETQKSGEASKAPEIDMSELESLFSAAVPSSGAKKSNVQSSVGPKSDKVQLIEHRRAYNCEIMLSQVKVPLHDLMSSVLALEDSAIDTDQVENLIKFCPTKEEMELVKGYNGEKEKLGRCEQFFMELMKVPRVESKLRVFSFKIQFHSQVSDLRSNLNAVNAAAEEIRSSVKLKRIMQTILSLGNALNQGTARGSAIGFRLDSLLKLADMRARNNKMTLMHYLCKVLADKLPEVLDFSKDLANLEPASKIQLKIMAEEMQAINKGLEKVVQELSTSENDGPISETFRKKLKEFLCSAEAAVRSLASVYSSVGRNVDALILYFGEDPSRCPFEQVVSTLLNFTRTFNKAHEENCKQLELEMKKTAESEKKKCESERILPTAIRTGNVK